MVRWWLGCAREAVPKILGPNHLGVVHHFALVGGDLQGGQHVVHSRQGGRARRHAVELPLQDVEARPPRHVGALEQVRKSQLSRPPSQSPPYDGRDCAQGAVPRPLGCGGEHWPLDKGRTRCSGSLSGLVPRHLHPRASPAARPLLGARKAMEGDNESVRPRDSQPHGKEGQD